MDFKQILGIAILGTICGGVFAQDPCLLVRMPEPLWTGADRVSITNELSKWTVSQPPIDFVVWSNSATGDTNIYAAALARIHYERLPDKISDAKITTLTNGLSTNGIEFVWTSNPFLTMTNDGYFQVTVTN